MIPGPIPPRFADSDKSVNRLSRRRFLEAGAAAGGGLMLSLSLPSMRSEAEAAGAGSFAPNAFIRINSDGEIVLTMPMSRWARATTPRSRC